MYEAYGRNKYSATGITAWKYDAAWPASPTWQFIDWYLLAGGAYYGAKKACEPLHIQYSYDDQSVVVVNGYYRPFDALTATATAYNLDMSERYSRSAAVSVAADGVTRAFTIDWPQDLSTTYFLVLTLEDSSGRTVSSNFYWFSTVPEVPGIKGYTENRAFYIHPQSVADYSTLTQLPPLRLQMQYEFAHRGSERIAHVTVGNPTDSLAFFVHLAVAKGAGGLEVTPTYWEDNYFSLLPGQVRTVRGAFAAEDLDGATPVVRLDGWNVLPSE